MTIRWTYAFYFQQGMLQRPERTIGSAHRDSARPGPCLAVCCCYTAGLFVVTHDRGKTCQGIFHYFGRCRFSKFRVTAFRDASSSSRNRRIGTTVYYASFPLLIGMLLLGLYSLWLAMRGKRYPAAVNRKVMNLVTVLIIAGLIGMFAGRYIANSRSNGQPERKFIDNYHKANSMRSLFFRSILVHHHNGNQPLIHPQPAGIAVTDSAARFIGWHAITILRVTLDQTDQMRVYFYNPNNDSGQNWGDGVTVSTAGHGERFGEVIGYIQRSWGAERMAGNDYEQATTRSTIRTQRPKI